jgi:alkylation response protein AidB-like acyl-CoA dehydrogenase
MTMASTRDDAEFREQVRIWIASNAPWHLKESIQRSPPGTLVLDEDVNAAQKAWQKKKFDAGWACLHWPAAYGGRDATPAQRIIWHQEEGVFARLGALFHNGQTMGAPTMMEFAGQTWKDRLLPRIASGEDVWCQLFSEPAAGSDLAGLRTKAQRQGDGWLVTGQKIWTSGGHYADWGILIARSDPAVAKHKGLTAFFVDMHSPGIEARPIRQMNDQTGFAEVFFDGVHIPDSQRLGGVGEGWRVALTMLSHERLAIGMEMPTGFDELFDYCWGLHCRDGGTLDDRQVQTRLSEFEANASGLGAFIMRAMARFADGDPPGPEASIVKLAAGKMMQEIAWFAMDRQGEAGILMGADETAYDGRFQGMLLRAPATRIEGGSDQILRNIIAERVLGMPPDLRADKDIPFNAIPTQYKD